MHFTTVYVSHALIYVHVVWNMIGSLFEYYYIILYYFYCYDGLIKFCNRNSQNNCNFNGLLFNNKNSLV